MLVSPVPGLITTPRLKEKVGEYVREGESILVVEEPADLEAEIAVPEQEVARVRAGQAVQLKPRALPFESSRPGWTGSLLRPRRARRRAA